MLDLAEPATAADWALYRALGLRPIAPYRFNPLPDTAYFELDLEGEPRC